MQTALVPHPVEIAVGTQALPIAVGSVLKQAPAASSAETDAHSLPAPHEPVKCLDDGVGQGVEVDWAVQHADTVAFLVDGLRSSSATGSGGVKRLPMPCDGKRRTVTILAFGATPPPAQESFPVVARS